MKRRWPFYTMNVGDWFVVESPPKTFNSKVHRYASNNGKKFRVRRVAVDWFQVRRVA